MKILLVNLHSSRNAGDDVLTRVTVDLLLRYFPEAKLTLAMNDPDSFEFVSIKVTDNFSVKNRREKLTAEVVKESKENPSPS